MAFERSLDKFAVKGPLEDVLAENVASGRMEVAVWIVYLGKHG